MPPFVGLRQRRLEPEIMDQPGLDAARHRQALDGLARINWVSCSGLILWPAIRDLCLERLRAGDRRPVRVLDVATGGGDIPIRLWRRARRRGLLLEAAGCDCSSVALDYARERAASKRADVAFFPLDILRDPLPEDYDVITASLFLHHLDAASAVMVLGKMRTAARRLVLINDLVRCRAGWWLAYLGARLLTRSPVVRVDAPLSVASAFTMAEALDLARQANWDGATVRWRWPFRYLLRWGRA
jgi:2-polyprenyl-3-methyl-5-hydroxy-6-metoxy-1,4-benzoquinol methylase